MFFRRREAKYRNRSAFANLFRLLTSLVVMAVLGVGVYQAVKSFSGIDPLKLDSKYLKIDILTTLLSTNTKQSLGKVIQPANTKKEGEVLFRFAIIGDSHKDTANLTKVLNLAKQKNARFIVGIGDLSDVGTVDELRNTKLQFDTANLPYYVTPGDHDLWDSRDKGKNASDNFQEVFGNTYQAFSYGKTRVVLLYNSDNYLGVDELQLKWIEDELLRIKEEDYDNIFIVGATPLYHPSSDHVMGKVTPNLKNQAEHLISIFNKAGIDEAVFADTHFFSRYNEPNTGLKITTVGAVTADRNPQTPRFAMVDVYKDGGYNIEEIEVK